MKFVILLLYTITAISASEHGNDKLEHEATHEKQWAVLVAGSDGWANYRHQADVCHAYQILLKRGIPASNIVVMMQDDIAHNYQNPNPGEIYNKPNGSNVYAGVHIDYRGPDVTPQNFLNVLKGNTDSLQGIGTGRAIHSGQKDHIFIYYSDHGGVGFLMFPNGYLTAYDLSTALKELSEDKKFCKMVLYIEACNSGSVFEEFLPRSTKILASTAAAPDESSWSTYCGYGSLPCLGDEYSVRWMEHVEHKMPAYENIFNQYQTVRAATKGSHVNLYGDYKIGTAACKEFIGPNKIETPNEKDDFDDENYGIKVPATEATLYWMKQMAKNSEINSFEKLKYAQMVSETEKNRKVIDEIMEKIIKKTTFDDEELQNYIVEKHLKVNMEIFPCYENLFKLFSDKCINMFKNPYAITHFYKFVNICHLDIIFHKNAKSSIYDICDSDHQKITGTV